MLMYERKMDDDLSLQAVALLGSAAVTPRRLPIAVVGVSSEPLSHVGVQKKKPKHGTRPPPRAGRRGGRGPH